MSELDQVLNKLEKVKRVGDSYLALCPAHNDKNPSLSIKQDNGKLLLHCHAGCSFAEIIKALDISGKNIKPEKTIKETYDYRDANGKLIYQVVRYEPKSFKQRRPSKDWTPVSRDYGDWIWDLKGIEPSLYRLPELIEGIRNEDIIFIVEGEKDADRLYREEVVATTCSGGSAQKWKPQYTFTLKGAVVRIIPDNDEAGLSFAKRVATQLYGWVKSIKIILLDVKDGGDISNWLDAGHRVAELGRIELDSPEFIPQGGVSREEFMELRGHLIYLGNLLMASKAKKKGRWLC